MLLVAEQLVLSQENSIHPYLSGWYLIKSVLEYVEAKMFPELGGSEYELVVGAKLRKVNSSNYLLDY